MHRIWRIAGHDERLVRELSSSLRMPPLLAQVIVARGYRTPEAATAYLAKKLVDLHEPEKLPGVSLAADRIVAAVQAGRRITVYGDYDVDGVTATSLLWHCLQLTGAKVDYYIPSRLEEGYGLNCDAIRQLHTEDANRLVVTVDCGITGTMPAYKAGWHEVTTHVVPLPLGFTIANLVVSLKTWDGLDAPSKALLENQAAAWSDKAWKLIEDENAMGLICTTGQGGTCSEGKPGKLTIVTPTDADKALLDKATQESVLARWAKRCGAACVSAWNDSVGKVVKLTAAP